MNFTKKNVAQILGITEQNLYDYEEGNIVIPVCIFRKLCNLYNVSEDSIRIPIVNDGEFDEPDFF